MEAAGAVLLRVLGITLRGEAATHARGPFPLTWHWARALLPRPCTAASSPAAYPPASVSTHQPALGRTTDPKRSAEDCEVAGFPPSQAWRADSPDVRLILF